MDFLHFEVFQVIFGVTVSFWKIRQLVIVSDFDDQGGISKPDTRRLIWVVSQVIRTHGLAARAILVQESWNIFWFRHGFLKIRQLVTTSNFGQEGLIWSVLVSAPHIGPGQVSSLKNKLSRALLVAAILQSEGFWAFRESAAHFWNVVYCWLSQILMSKWQMKARYQRVNLSGFLGHFDSWFGR